MMQKILILFLIPMFIALGVHAQSLRNTSWKTYIGDPVYDTLTLHIRTDSSFVSNSKGDVVVRSRCKMAADTLSLDDYDGQYQCPGMIGKYKVSVSEGVLSFVLIEDACDGRAQTLSTTKWRKEISAKGL